jgi:cytochrome c553
MKLQTKLVITAAAFALTTWSVRSADVKENWDKNCLSCHGKDGKGETKAGKKAGVKDFTDAKYQEAMADDKMAKQIKEGMKEGDKEKMKPFAAKLTDEEIKGLVAHIRSFKK